MPVLLFTCIEEAGLIALLVCLVLIEVAAGFFACVGFIPIYLYITISECNFDESSPRPVLE